MSTRHSTTIELSHGVTADVKADAEGVTFGVQSDGSLLTDMNLPPEQAMEIADALTAGAAHCLAARGEA